MRERYKRNIGDGEGEKSMGGRQGREERREHERKVRTGGGEGEVSVGSRAGGGNETVPHNSR